MKVIYPLKKYGDQTGEGKIRKKLLQRSGHTC